MLLVITELSIFTSPLWSLPAPRSVYRCRIFAVFWFSLGTAPFRQVIKVGNVSFSSLSTPDRLGTERFQGLSATFRPDRIAKLMLSGSLCAASRRFRKISYP